MRNHWTMCNNILKLNLFGTNYTSAVRRLKRNNPTWFLGSLPNLYWFLFVGFTMKRHLWRSTSGNYINQFFVLNRTGNNNNNIQKPILIIKKIQMHWLFVCFLKGGTRSGDILVVRSGRVLPLGEWARIRAGRYGRRIFLWVNFNF